MLNRYPPMLNKHVIKHLWWMIPVFVLYLLVVWFISFLQLIGTCFRWLGHNLQKYSFRLMGYDI